MAKGVAAQTRGSFAAVALAHRLHVRGNSQCALHIGALFADRQVSVKGELNPWELDSILFADNQL